MSSTTVIEFQGPFSKLLSYRIDRNGDTYQAWILWPSDPEVIPEAFKSPSQAFEALIDIDRNIEANLA